MTAAQSKANKKKLIEEARKRDNAILQKQAQESKNSEHNKVMKVTKK